MGWEGLGLLLAACFASTMAGAQEAAAPLTVIFSSVEIGPSAYVNAGFKRALGVSLYEEGFLVMGNVGGGRRREKVAQPWGLSRVDHLSAEASLLAGYQWKTERAVVAVFAGPELQHKQPVVDGAILEAERSSIGGRLMAEVWAHPTENTLATGTLLVGTAPQRIWTRAQFGWRILDGVYAGPEAVFSAEESYRETRFGLHVTGLTFGAYTFNLSGGVLVADDDRPGGYVGLTMHFNL
ncbi:MAG TPA: cellulose biosynthesis protein BcsS [Microvirga sp.]|jgi:hypothetical protein|nr:cellulose biosynthesis protein BcsS [Microvirga sp.]